MTLVTPYPVALYHGASLSTEVPFKYPVALDGTPMMLDTVGDQWRHLSIQHMRPQSDQSSSPAEASLNPEGLWRRAQESWHRGAGQDFRDRPKADEERFNRSKGIDPWDFYKFSLLPDTVRVRVDPYLNSSLAVAGNRLYNSNLNGLAYTTNLSTWTAVTGTPVNFVTGLASNGETVYTAHGIDGIYSTNRHIGNTTPYVTGSVNGPLGYVKGRLMASDSNNLYNIIAGGVKPTPLLPHPNFDFLWVGYAAGKSHIYAAGYSGDKSLIYKTAIKADGTALDVPSVAGELPDGELIRCIDGYLGFILLGTSLGVRFCTAEDTSGDLTIGPLIETPQPVRCFEGQGRYVWFGWSQYDSTSTGLGRMDLTSFVESIETGARVPSHASDLMVTGTWDITSIATFLGKRVFAVAGSGIWTEADTLVPEGTLESGMFAFGIPDLKVALFTDVRTEAMEGGSYSAALSTDGGLYVDLGEQTLVASVGKLFSTRRDQGERYQLRLTLRSSGSLGPVITRYTLKASAGPQDGPAEFIYAPFLLHSVIDPGGDPRYMDVRKVRDKIKLLYQSGIVVTYQEATSSYDVIVDGYEWIPHDFTTSSTGSFNTPDGTMLTKLKRIS